LGDINTFGFSGKYPLQLYYKGNKCTSKNLPPLGYGAEYYNYGNIAG
jgi:hypothetical protein